MSRCSLCRVESSRERLRTLARRTPRIAAWLFGLALASIALGLVLVALWGISTNAIQFGVTVAAFALAPAFYVVRAALLWTAPVFQRAIGKPLPFARLPRPTPTRAPEDPGAGVAYRAVTIAEPPPPVRLCVRHLALASQNQLPSPRDRA